VDCQLPLDFTGPRARTSDPATSHAAAASVRDFAGEQYVEVLKALERGPGTIWELAERCSLDRVQIARRLPEMQKAIPPLARPTEETRPSPKGRPCRVWRRT
jgi:hypothetical protein